MLGRVVGRAQLKDHKWMDRTPIISSPLSISPGSDGRETRRAGYSAVGRVHGIMDGR
jgi:hypothetical protein